MFFQAIMRDDVETVAHLVDRGVNIKTMRNGARQSPLQVATLAGKVKVATFLQDEAIASRCFGTPRRG
jgi:hypothetical protein